MTALMQRPRAPKRSNVVRWCELRAAMLALLLGTAVPAAAFDFGKLIENVGKGDVDKLLETGKRVVAATRSMTEAEEIHLGRDLAGRLLGAMPPLRQAEAQAYINRLGRWLTLQTTRPNLPWHFAIVTSDSLGAFATPGGHVLVTTALIRLMRDESELAGVLAHEIAHVIERHHVEAVMKKARAALARDVAADVVADYTKGNPLVRNALLEGGMNLYASGLDQGDEFAADLTGVTIAARAGYDPFGLLMLLTTLDALDPAEPRASLLFATHPDTRERIERVAAAAASRLEDYGTTLRDLERFDTLQAELAAQR
ncbi:MAG: M48 family metalloprotease [Gammaproteobacteria bacterium]